jgi:RNA-directed DNA polymerase
MPEETKPMLVSQAAKQVGEIHGQWSWVESSVWTERMLTALETGVKGGKWFSLIDKVYRESNLRAAFYRVQANKGAGGVDNQTIIQFSHRLSEHLAYASESLRSQKYRPRAIKRVWIPKPGGKEKRPLGIPTVLDRVIQTALRNVLEPIFERDFAEHSYGFRPMRGCKGALRRVDGLLNAGYNWVIDADLKRYFDMIPHDKLMDRVKEKVADSRILGLIEMYLQQKVLEGVSAWTPETGSPQGAVISPLLSNIYLDPLDHKMADAGYEMIRYADDFVILCRSESQAREAMQEVAKWCETSKLELHSEKTQIVDAAQGGGFDFLGYHFERGYKWPSDKSSNKLKDAIRAKTHRCNGHSLDTIIFKVNQTTKGWFEYFKHSYFKTFARYDGWIRMRLRSILRKRMHLEGRGRGKDHQRWPNAYFAEHGLFSLVAAYEQLVNPRRGTTTNRRAVCGRTACTVRREG